MTKLLIIIPAYNEQDNIERVVENLREKYPQWDRIVINDGSTDNTARICRQHGYPLLNLPMNLGLAGAFQAGIRYAYQNGYTAALQFDGDGQHEPYYITEMLEKMEKEDLEMFCRFWPPIIAKVVAKLYGRAEKSNNTNQHG